MTTGHTPRVRTLEGGPFRSLEEFLRNKGPKPQLFRLNPERLSTVVGQQGTRLTFLPDSLSDYGGQSPKGTVDVYLTEIFQPAEMVLANRSSISEDRVLETGGQFLLSAQQGSRPLELRQPLEVALPFGKHLRNPLGLRLFEGSVPTVRALSAQPGFDWRMLEKSKVKLHNINGRAYHTFSIPSFNWYSCSHFLPPRSNKVMLSVHPVAVVERFDHQLAFLSFKGTKAVVRMYWGGNHFAALNIPARASAEVVVLAIKDGQLFLGRSCFQRAAEKVVKVYLNPCAEADIIEALQQL